MAGQLTSAGAVSILRHMSSVNLRKGIPMRVRRANRGFTILLHLPRGYVLKLGTWRYNPTGRAAVPGAYVRQLQATVHRSTAAPGSFWGRARGVRIERSNCVARNDHLTLAYAPCRACGRDSGQHTRGTLRPTLRTYVHGYPQVTCAPGILRGANRKGT